jgi:hypothetical protein
LYYNVKSHIKEFLKNKQKEQILNINEINNQQTKNRKNKNKNKNKIKTKIKINCL